MNRDSRYSGRAEFDIDGPRSRPFASRLVGRSAPTASAPLEAASRLGTLYPPCAQELRQLTTGSTPGILSIDILASEILPLGTVVFVFTPECDAPMVAR